MEEPLCFTKFFVDKQNVRSFGNIFNIKLLREQNWNNFILDVFVKDPTLVSALTSKFLELLITLGNNLRDKFKDDFKSYFMDKQKSRVLEPISKCYVFERCWSALKDLIPEEFFGNKQNQNLLKTVIQNVIYGMKRQHIQLLKIIYKWNFSCPYWQFLDESKSIKILFIILTWILEKVLSAIVSLNFYVTASKMNCDENKLYFFCKNLWQSFYDKSIQKMIQQSIIKKVDCCSVGKNIKRKYSFNVKKKLRMLRKDIPKLHLVLKGNEGYRCIIRYKYDAQSQTEKNKIRKRLSFLKLLTGQSGPKLELVFNSLFLKWIELKRPKLYFIKTDLSNAFGCVDRKKLIQIFYERFQDYSNSEKNIQRLEWNTKLFKEIELELRRHFLVRAGSTVYEWRKGLVQGYKYSPALSELFYTHHDEIYLAKHLEPPKEKEIKFFTRVVDDYLYITNSLEDANFFLQAMQNYNNVNYDKTVVNFISPGIKYSEELTFLGYCYNTVEMQVSRAQYIFTGQMCYKISFNDTIDHLHRFLESRIGQSSMKINGHTFNFFYNTESVIWKHIFTTFCLSANKFCTILALLCDANNMWKFMELYKKKVTVKISNTIIDVLSRNKPVDFRFVYCINHLRYVSWLSLSLCAKQTPKCSKIVPLINDELAKANCIFGKWKEHSSRIDENGVMLKKARREFCSRLDLRVIMRQFNCLPDGFQCFNHKLFFKDS